MNGRRADLDLALAEALRPLVAELVEIELERRLEELAVTDWLTLDETGPYLRTTVEALRARARRGQLPGAVKDGARWRFKCRLALRAQTTRQECPPRSTPSLAPSFSIVSVRS